MSTEPLVVEFEVAAAPEQAFDAWTRRCATWWPASHTVGGDPSAITFEPRPGGRIFERSGDREADWGTVLEWDPPARLRYLWHLFFDAAEATEVEVRFTPVPGGTVVRLEQSGWERLGDVGARRERTSGVWALIGEAFAEACRPAEPESRS
jgi:uncharacterized protein YndB with AHSA1/START domain